MFKEKSKRRTRSRRKVIWIFQRVSLTSPFSMACGAASESGESKRAGLFLDRWLLRVAAGCESERCSVWTGRSARCSCWFSRFSFNRSDLLSWLFSSELADLLFDGGGRGEGRLPFIAVTVDEDIDVIVGGCVTDGCNIDIDETNWEGKLFGWRLIVSCRWLRVNVDEIESTAVSLCPSVWTVFSLWMELSEDSEVSDSSANEGRVDDDIKLIGDEVCACALDINLSRRSIGVGGLIAPEGHSSKGLFSSIAVSTGPLAIALFLLLREPVADGLIFTVISLKQTTTPSISTPTEDLRCFAVPFIWLRIEEFIHFTGKLRGCRRKENCWAWRDVCRPGQLHLIENVRYPFVCCILG